LARWRAAFLLSGRLHRERDRLINERAQHVNCIKGLRAVHGIYDYEALRKSAGSAGATVRH
jgi:hypothetical protein